MAKFVGIDLGTTFSAIAVLDELGRPEMISVDQHRIVPSVVYFDESDVGNVIVGYQATNALSDPEVGGRVIQDVKRHMGDGKKYSVDGNEFTPVQIASFILKKLVKEASELKGLIGEVIITVPANFSERERKATMDAGEMAGLKVKHIINEPTAAAIYYASQNPISGTVLVYDLGGGTFDVTIARYQGKEVKVLCSQGDRHLGGKDFDQKLLDVFDAKYMAKFGTRLVNSENRESWLSEAAKIKQNLSAKTTQSVRLVGTAGAEKFEISRTEFEQAISTYMAKTELLIDALLDEASLSPKEIDHILLVGGSTRIPSVQESLKRIFKKDPLKSVNPDEAVALGAAIYAGLSASAETLNAAQAASIGSIKLTEICNDFFGTISISEHEQTGMAELVNSIVLAKNTPLPCSVTKTFYTVMPGQTSVNCKVTQSKNDETDPEFVHVVWEGSLDNLPAGRPPGQPIAVTYSYDMNGRMNCSYTDVNSGKTTTVDLHPNSDKSVDKQKAAVDDFLVE